MANDNLLRRESPSLENKAIFKGKDLGLVREVSNFLISKDLEPQLKGSARKNIKKGLPRNYEDIDISIDIGEENFKGNYRSLAQVISKLDLASQGYTKINNWEVENLTKRMPRYMDLNVDYRFRITNPKTNTKIDLVFGNNEDLLPHYLNLR